MQAGGTVTIDHMSEEDMLHSKCTKHGGELLQLPLS
jgi:hypothetical protein